MGKTENFLLFIVEDDPFYAELLAYHLSQNPDFTVCKYRTARECLNNLHLKPSAITLDYRLPDMDGVMVLQRIKSFDPNIEVVIVSGQEEVATAIDLLRLGAYDYLVKNEETRDRLWRIMLNIRHKEGLRIQVEALQNEVARQYKFANLSGSSPQMKLMQQLIYKAAQTNISVTITGETGTGKEMVARAIHYTSVRAKGPFVTVNVAAIPRELIESELFGHEKGAFTGAVSRRIGKFEEAHTGTLFLDEIGELDMSLQAKFLRVLQEKEFTRVGATGVISYDARIVCATHKNLSEEVKQGRFREDLYYRLLGLPIHLPPLRGRGADILILAQEFLAAFCKENRIPLKEFSQDARERLLQYSYPGNVRELKAIVELAIVLAPDNMIQSDHIQFQQLQEVNPIDFSSPLTLKQMEIRIIQQTLDRCGGDVLEAARRLDVGKSTIYRLLKSGELKQSTLN